MSWYNSNGETAIIIINVLTIVLSIVSLKYAPMSFTKMSPFTLAWGILMFLYYYLVKILVIQKTDSKSIDVNQLTNHRKNSFHLSLLSYYIQFVFVSFIFFSSKNN